jgi:hypothetical protein
MSEEMNTSKSFLHQMHRDCSTSLPSLLQYMRVALGLESRLTICVTFNEYVGRLYRPFLPYLRVPLVLESRLTIYVMFNENPCSAHLYDR